MNMQPKEIFETYFRNDDKTMDDISRYKKWNAPTYKYNRLQIPKNDDISGGRFEKVVDKDGYYSYDFNQPSAIEYVRLCPESELEEIVYNIPFDGTFIYFVIRELCQRRQWVFDYFKNKNCEVIKDYPTYSEYLFTQLKYRKSSLIAPYQTDYNISMQYNKFLKGDEYVLRTISKNRVFCEMLYIESQMWIMTNLYDEKELKIYCGDPDITINYVKEYYKNLLDKMKKVFTLI